MPTAAVIALAVIAAYLVGSVPFAVVVSRFCGLADPRSYGSKNPGATNVLRSGNKKAAALTLAGDALKGFVAVFVADMAQMSPLAVGLVAVAVFAGHLYPVFLRFKGGKGVATAAGVILALDPILALGVLGTWVAVVYASRYSSLAAISAAAVAPLLAGMMHGVGGNVFPVVGVLALALIGRHWQNLQRLLAGQESKVGANKA